MAPTFTREELAYLEAQRIGRLATVDPSGAPQNNPVGFFLDQVTGAITIGGLELAKSRKFRNVLRNPNVALVVDDLASVDPWVVRGVEIRGTAEAVTDEEPPMRGLSREVIRITPHWIASWGLDGNSYEMDVRT